MSRVFVLAAGNERGGGASHLVTYARALKASSSPLADNIVFVIAGDGYLRERLEPVAAHVEIINGAPRAAIAALTALLARHPEAHVHAHGPRWNLIASRASRAARRSWTATIHSHPKTDFLTSRWKSVVLPRLNRLALRRAAGLFVVHPQFAQLFPDKPCRFVPNAVEPVQLSQPKEFYRKQLRDRLNLAEDTLVAGTAARLDKVKDLDTMIRAFALLPADRHLAIAGDGPERDHLQALCRTLDVQDRVHFLGFIDDVHTFYAGLDVHVLSSISEGTPTSVLEAGWLRVPNVGTDIPGLTHLIVNDETGCTCPVGDAAALAAALSRVLDHPERAVAYAARFYDTVLPRFLPSRMVDAYFEGYETFFRERE
ncbi:glycosyltransferase [Alicyclobacillus cycloheptanicus]|uniref:Glycosyltransferase involved in cell wall biosynthesis n=1 Tax=Alicyclobacillus cycloheptanicus TaxID=1457 RepID=A0ABT9XHQ4_9BACL|nr:glycosyltransferase [Alicyclobacillus cycloheptanicus]MDQ0189241.1 glycosyltransferase involved in cell wall biosynthesis [Alicyclobacillus cycloheptanicus]WDM00425.1 glycosyltransferase [Alicyclobacillus cycloheptanicus]